MDEWKAHREVLRHPEDHTDFEVGFSTFYLNRTNRSGVLTGGVIGGLGQSGKWKIDARFPRNELITRIELIASLRIYHALQPRRREFFATAVKTAEEIPGILRPTIFRKRRIDFI